MGEDPERKDNQWDSLVVFDLEYTAWEGSEERLWSRLDENREIIQFGAVIMYHRSNRWKKGGVFEMYVRPTFRPTLSDYITTLTGISQDTIDRFGKDFISALKSFREIDQNVPQCVSGAE